MISVEEKLDVFTQYLLEEKQKEADALIAKAAQQQNEKKTAAEKSLQNEKRALEEHNYQVIARDANRYVAQGKSIAKELRLNQIKIIREDFEIVLHNRAVDFVENNVLYAKYLKKCVDEIPNYLNDQKTLIIFVRDQDRDILSSLLSDGYHLTIRALPPEAIGGIIVRDADNRINCDFSVSGLIKDNAKFVNLLLDQFMKQQVDANE